MSTEISDQELVDLLAICEAATPGPWEYHGRGISSHEIVTIYDKFPLVLAQHRVPSLTEPNLTPKDCEQITKDYSLMALARIALPNLIRALQEERTKVRELIGSDAATMMQMVCDQRDAAQEEVESLRGQLAEKKAQIETQRTMLSEKEEKP